jgi:lycopene beta-cyclase
VNQQHGATFVYTMPLNERQALIEYTLFSEQLLSPEDYEAGLRSYIRDFLKLDNYTITEKEFGIIPMTNYKFPEGAGKIVNIGIAGGQTKSSSGYTFQFIQKNTQAILDALLQTGNPRVSNAHRGRFRFYDNVLLDVLLNKEITGARIFTQLFKRNKVQRIFRFLDNESLIPEEVYLMGSLPTWPFFRAAKRVI